MTTADLILTRRFEWAGNDPVDIHVWRPVEIAPKGAYVCAYQIDGLEGSTVNRCHGSDGLQALNLTLTAIAARLYNSDAYLTGRLTYLGGRDLGLPYFAGEDPTTGAFGQAKLMTPAGNIAVVRMPGHPVPYVACAVQSLDSLTAHLAALKQDMETQPGKAGKRLRRIIAYLEETRAFYDEACGHSREGKPPAQTGPEQSPL
ncbi:DUF6968 family protein [Asticcacaulis sp. AC466]